MTLEELHKLPFVEISKVNGLPSCTGVYIAMRGDNVLYVGRSVAIRSRWVSHNHKARLIALEGSRIAWVECSSREEMAATEKRLIIALSPLWNKAPSARLGRSRLLTPIVTHAAPVPPAPRYTFTEREIEAAGNFLREWDDYLFCGGYSGVAEGLMAAVRKARKEEIAETVELLGLNAS